MSSFVKWGDILFLAPWSVCLSVRLSVRHDFVSALYRFNPVFQVGFISFQPLVGFTNYSAQMSRMMR